MMAYHRSRLFQQVEVDVQTITPRTQDGHITAPVMIDKSYLAKVCSVFVCSHHFTTAFTPGSNGSVERVCREVLRAWKDRLPEWKLAPKHWPAVSECVQSVLIQAPLKRFGPRSSGGSRVYRTPLEGSQVTSLDVHCCEHYLPRSTGRLELYLKCERGS